MHYAKLGRMHSKFTIFSNGSIIPPGFKFTELHTLTLAAHSYAFLFEIIHSIPTALSYTDLIISSILLLGVAECRDGIFIGHDDEMIRVLG